jgi:hypothetical protein
MTQLPEFANRRTVTSGNDQATTALFDCQLAQRIDRPIIIEHVEMAWKGFHIFGGGGNLA